MPIRFLHLADPHIDSPMRGLQRYESAPVEQLRSATRAAFRNAIDLAIDREIPLVVIAGDLFDGAWDDMKTGMWTVEQFERLRTAGIRVCLIRGNHDAISQIPTRLPWPDNVFEFATDRPTTRRFADLGIAVHGQSFEGQAETTDLAKGYPAAVEGMFNIGLLHTSLEGDAAHATYAPTTLPTLYGRGYDYWALGHIHKREQFDGPHPVVFAGNLQGRHIRETGPRGGIVVQESVDGLDLQFVPLDTVRWERIEIAADGADSIADLVVASTTALEAARREAGGRLLAVRICIAGTTTLSEELSLLTGELALQNAIQKAASQWADVWIERIEQRVRPPVRLEAIRRDGGVLSLLIDQIETGDVDTEDAYDSYLKPLAKKLRKAGINPEDCGIVASLSADEWRQQAEAELLTALAADR